MSEKIINIINSRHNGKTYTREDWNTIADAFKKCRNVPQSRFDEREIKDFLIEVYFSRIRLDVPMVRWIDAKEWAFQPQKIWEVDIVLATRKRYRICADDGFKARTIAMELAGSGKDGGFVKVLDTEYIAHSEVVSCWEKENYDTERGEYYESEKGVCNVRY